MAAQPDSGLPVAPETSTRTTRRQPITAVAVLVALVCSGVTSCTRTQIVLSSAAIAAAVAGTAVGVTLAVKHHNHTLQGCVSSDANALRLRTSNAKVYTLEGDPAGIKPGDSVKLHGSRKKAKGGNQVFVVQKLTKDFGPCV